MTFCIVEKLPNGGFRVSRDFSSLPPAMAGMSKILSVVEDAFIPAPQDLPLSPAAGIQIAAAENQD